MDTLKNTVNYVGDKANELTSGAKKETDKEIAKDPNQNVGDRISSAGSALKEGAEEKKNAASAEANKPT